MKAAPKVRLRRPAEGAPPVIEFEEITIKLFPTGSTLLDQVLGGGYALGRMVNIVGDESTGKSLLGIEGAANCARMYGAGNVRYVETESAWNPTYAERVGMPRGIQYTSEVRTVEEFNDDLHQYLADLKGEAGLYILDSLDALSSQAEMSREITDKSHYSTEKAIVLGELFRRQCVDIGSKNVCLLIISQTRTNIGNIFRPKTRSGGKALDFYASQIIWLSERGQEKRVVSGVERVAGINVRVQCRKNKIGEPFRSVDMLIVFNYGVDDELSNIEWLKKNRADDADLSIPLDRYAMAVRKARDARDHKQLMQYGSELRAATIARWRAIEDALAPPVRKYELVE
jgi:RecA/RadA recombinase